MMSMKSMMSMMKTKKKKSLMDVVLMEKILEKDVVLVQKCSAQIIVML